MKRTVNSLKNRVANLEEKKADLEKINKSKDETIEVMRGELK